MSARRLAAAIGGAIEGFVEAMETYDPGEEARAGFQAAGEIAREGGAEAKALAQTPEMRELGRDLKAAGQTTAQAAGRAADAVKDTVTDAKDAVRRAADVATEGVRVRAEAVAETGRRAKAAPRRIGRELKLALKSWWGGLVTAFAMALAIGILAIVTLVVLTIALVVSLNQILGDPRGTWATVLVYVASMLIAYGVMRAQSARARRETRRRVETSKAEARRVVAPVQSAFGGRGRAGF